MGRNRIAAFICLLEVPFPRLFRNTNKYILYRQSYIILIIPDLNLYAVSPVHFHRQKET